MKKISAELLPPEPSKSTLDAAQVAQLVKEQVTAILANHEDLILRPFFDTHNLSAELRRMQKMPARRKWSVYFEQWGCLICKTKKSTHSGCGMCSTCYVRVAERLRTIVGENASQRKRQQFNGDLQVLARKALLEAVESFTPPEKGGQ